MIARCKERGDCQVYVFRTKCIYIHMRYFRSSLFFCLHTYALLPKFIALLRGACAAGACKGRAAGLQKQTGGLQSLGCVNKRSLFYCVLCGARQEITGTSGEENMRRLSCELVPDSILPMAMVLPRPRKARARNESLRASRRGRRPCTRRASPSRRGRSHWRETQASRHGKHNVFSYWRKHAE